MLTKEAEGVTKYHLYHQPAVADPLWNLTIINNYRTRLYQVGMIGQSPERYMGLGYGNISQRYNGEQFIISGTQTGGVPELSMEHYCLVTKADLVMNTLYSIGPCNPSSEALSHASVYQQDQMIQCVIHAHSPMIWHATKALKLAHTSESVAYGTPAMAHAINDLFNMGQLAQVPLFTLLGHEDGVIAFGQSFPQAFAVMIRTLTSAKLLS